MKLMATLMCLCKPFDPQHELIRDQTLSLVLVTCYMSKRHKIYKYQRVVVCFKKKLLYLSMNCCFLNGCGKNPCAIREGEKCCNKPQFVSKILVELLMWCFQGVKKGPELTVHVDLFPQLRYS